MAADTAQDLRIRPPTKEDIQQVLAFILRQEIEEYGEEDTELEDLQHDWRQISLPDDAWLAESQTGEIIGYGTVMPWGSDLRLEFYSDHREKSPRLANMLIELGESRAREIIARQRPGGNVQCKCYISHSNPQYAQALADHGYSVEVYIHQMQIQLENYEKKDIILPPEVHFRTAVDGQDDRKIYSLIQEAFALPGRTPSTFEEWKSHLMRPEIYEPDLWFLAVAGGEIIGASLSFDYPLGGWVRQLGVSPNWQGNGIGSALLQKTFLTYKALGRDQAGLTVESTRPDALKFYLRAGLKPIRQYDGYNKLI